MIEIEILKSLTLVIDDYEGLINERMEQLKLKLNEYVKRLGT